MSHVARRFQFFSGHDELMSTFQCNCNSCDSSNFPLYLVTVIIHLSHWYIQIGAHPFAMMSPDHDEERKEQVSKTKPSDEELARR